MFFADADKRKEIINRAINKIEIVCKNPLTETIEKGIIDKFLQAKKTLEDEKLRIDELNDDNSERFNEQFVAYAKSDSDSVLRLCEGIINTQCDKWSFSQLSSYILNVLDTAQRNTIFSLFKQFRYGDSNYVLFGKNGAGKTTLLNALSKQIFTTNTLVLSAIRNTNYSNTVYHQHSDINLKTALSSKEDNKSMFYLSQLIAYKNTEERDSGIPEKETIKSKVISIFDSLKVERKLSIKPNGDLELVTSKGESYSLSQASDGEKSALFFIMVVLLAPEKSFVFIDEPENHLNGSLMQRLFNSLEKERNDLRFIYSTHNISFIQSRNNIEIVYLRKVARKNEWAFNKFDEFKELPLSVVLEVEGTSNDVIFCEGEDASSFDSRLYSLLFPSYQVIPSQGCDKVIIQTTLFNENSSILRKKAYGIIDNDFSDANRISELNAKKVFVLKVNEIENAYLLPRCIKEMIMFLGLEQTENDIQKKIVDFIKTKKSAIEKDFATKLLRRLHRTNKIDEIDNISSSIDRINSENKASFLTQFNVFDANFDLAVNNCDYNELMRIVPGKMIINEVARIMGLSGKEAYIKQVLRLVISKNSMVPVLRNGLVDFVK